MIVVDTNVIAYLYLASPHAAEAEEALRQDPEWAVPILWRSEFRNVLAHYLRKDLLTLEDAYQILAEAASLMHRREYRVASLPVLDLVTSSTCSAYDSEFVALAQDLEVPLVTTDRQILGQFPQVAISLDAFTHP
ncbi:MAG: type II toxin-antitoxin system VapC family toxin [Anaerolineae bacterium]